MANSHKSTFCLLQLFATLLVLAAVCMSLTLMACSQEPYSDPKTPEVDTPIPIETPVDDPEADIDMPYNEVPNCEVVASDHTPMQGNAVWCAPLQICWNKMEEMVNGGEVFTSDGVAETARELNEGSFDTSMISDDHYYAYGGYATRAARAEIEQALLEKFSEPSDILDMIPWAESEEEAMMLAYSMLFRNFNFETHFSILDEGSFGSEAAGNYSEGVSYFGAYDGEDAFNQVLPLYYLDEDHFAVRVNTVEGDVLYFVRGVEGSTVDEMWQNMIASWDAVEYTPNASSFKAPSLTLDLFKDYEELADQIIPLNNGDELRIAKAIQTVHLDLNNKGGRIKSEAAIVFETTAAIDEPEESFDFVFDDSFVLFVVDGNVQGETYPYFALHVEQLG